MHYSVYFAVDGQVCFIDGFLLALSHHKDTLQAYCYPRGALMGLHGVQGSF